MGNQAQYNNPDIWSVVQEYPYYQLLKSQQGNQVERYFISTQQYKRLFLRASAPETWVQILSCSNKDNVCYIIVQKIKRLYEIEEVSIEEGLRILKQIVKGYISLSKQYGRFQLTSKMIGLNIKNQVRVWIHQNFASNNPMKPMSISDKDIFIHILNIVTDISKLKNQNLMTIFQMNNFSTLQNILKIISTIQNQSKTKKKISLTKLNTNKSPRNQSRKFQVSPKVETSQPVNITPILPLFTRKRISNQNKLIPIQLLQLQSKISPRRVTMQPLISPRLSSRRTTFHSIINQQEERSSIKLLELVSNKHLKRANSPDFSTNYTLNTQRETVLDLYKQQQSLKKIRSQSSFASKQWLQQANSTRLFIRQVPSKTFPLNIPIAISLDEVPSKEVIVIDQSIIIRG